MNEERFSSEMDPFGESGRTIPPVEGAWSLMRKKLDARLPVSLLRMYSRAAWWSGAGAAVVAATVIIFSLVSQPAHHSPGPNPAAKSTITNAAPAASVPSATPATSAVSAAPAAPAGSVSKVPGTSKAPETNTEKTNHPLAASVAKRQSTRDRSTSDRSARRQSPSERSTSEQSVEERSASEKSAWAQSASEQPTSKQPTNKPSAVKPTSGRPTRQPSALQRASLAHIAAVTHNPYCRVADSLLKATSAHKRQWAVTAAIVPEKKRSLPGKRLRMAAGIAAGKTFPIDGQKANAYDASGNKAGLADYIPHVYFRYYPKSNSYIQADLALHSPQYTHPLVVDSAKVGTSNLPGWQSAAQYNTITLKKLYYNDLWLSFHHRLFNGLWLGAGIQLSFLQNAVGENATMLLAGAGGRDTVFGAKIYGMRSGGGDYNELPKKDWRLTLQAEYSWRRWMLCVFYKESIHTYTDEFLSGYNAHYRNSSWGVYLSYDLWEKQRRRGQSGPQ